MHYFKQPVILKAYVAQKIVCLWSCDLLPYSYSRLGMFVGQFWMLLVSWRASPSLSVIAGRKRKVLSMHNGKNQAHDCYLQWPLAAIPPARRCSDGTRPRASSVTCCWKWQRSRMQLISPGQVHKHSTLHDWSEQRSQCRNALTWPGLAWCGTTKMLL